ncbi:MULTISPECIES: helicase-related protein [Clostridium]|jgi:N12 class adenine-specific DNA methylase|uniref:helicase-related protein n=1 Tax=Clostridium TaxID=1485 RepID=UPI000E8E8CEE|nr:helicase-related protein [Clostridium tyrobutyricum]HBF78249.1 hypothetical protein [Clostridiaceae bacterium]
MNNALKQMSFWGDDELQPQKHQKNKQKYMRRKRDKKDTANSSQNISLFEIINNFVKEENKTVIETEPVKTTEDYTLTEKVLENLGSVKARLTQNIACIKLIKKLKAKNLYATFVEQNVLAKFTGFGALQEAFDENSKYEEERETLKSLLTEEEYTSAKETVNNAFYTDTTIINFMYKALEQMGFKGGDILEPACGIGNFFGAMPMIMRSNSTLKGVEIDTLSGEIAKQLYQNADIEINPFEESLTYPNYYDLVVGNVPFGNYGVFDKEYNKYNLSIHNYFIVKSLDKLRVGGILAVVTSKFTMDSKTKTTRELIKNKAKVISAFRLPQNAFKEYARTDAVTDIIFLQKTDRMNTDADTETFLTVDERGINNYYNLHPDHILGTLEEQSGMYGPELVPVLKDKTLDEAFSEVLNAIPTNIYTPYDGEKERILPLNNYDIKPFGYDFINGKLVQNQNGKLVGIDKVTNKKNLQMYKDFVELKKHVHKVLQAQVHKCSDSALNELLQTLNVMYDRFVYNYQYIDTKACKMKFKDDPDYPLLCALEIHTNDGVKKADIFYKRTIRNDLYTHSIDTAKDALSYCINKYGYVNLDFIKQIYKKSESEILAELDGLIYVDPETNQYVLAAEYLSGNVVEKLHKAKDAAGNNELFKVNVEALEKVQPIPLTYDQIDVKLGTSFIPVDYYSEFLRYLLDANDSWRETNVYIEYISLLDEYKVYGNVYVSYTENYEKWGTRRRTACELIEEALNNKTPKVYDTKEDNNGKEIRVLNKEETIEAETKQQMIKEEFKKWIYEDKERRENIEKTYNKLYNSFVDKKYNGAMLTLPGKNPEIELRDYQKNAIARGVLENNSLLLFHHVGAGKSYVMMAIGMEMKRLGICNKPLYVVPNHMVQSGQFYQEFLKLYPNAKLLVATSDDFSKNNRAKLISKIATGDWDGIVIGHSSLIKIPVSKEFQENMMNKQIQEIEDAIREYSIGRDKKMTVKKLQSALKNQKLKLQKLKDINQDNTVTFEELGIDQLFIDESQNFKNLFTYTKMQNVAGVQTTSAQKTDDLLTKIQYIYSIRGEGKGIVFSSGTPISNSMSELYTTQRYLQPQILRAQGIDTFDKWASVFGEVVNSVEISPTGKGFRQKQRFSRFHNVPELTSIFRQCTDVVLKNQLNISVPKSEYHKIEIPAISAVTNYINNELLPRAKAISNKQVEPEVDNMLKVTNDGRKAALDIRLIDVNAKIDGPTKTSVCAENIFKIWQETTNVKGTQLIFCDLGTPKKQSVSNQLSVVNNIINNSTNDTDNDIDESAVDEVDLFDDTVFDVYHEIKQLLMEKGIPENEIAFIHDAKTPAQKSQMIKQFRKGDIRILLGSTSKMGEGLNAQDKIVAIHHVDVPWKPSGLQQRDGRGVRNGNTNEKVDIYRYVTKGTFDAYSWQTLQTKAQFIGQILCGMSNERAVDDVDVQLMNYAEMKASASDNPLILKKFELEVELKKLNVLEKNFLKNKYSIQDKIIKLEKTEKIYGKNLISYKQDVKLIRDMGTKIITINGVEEELNLKLIEQLTPKINLALSGKEVYLGDYLGMKMYGENINIGDGIRSTVVYLHGIGAYKITYETQLSLLRQLTGFKESLISKKVPNLTNALNECVSELAKLRIEYDKKFAYTETLINTKHELDEVNKQLGI